MSETLVTRSGVILLLLNNHIMYWNKSNYPKRFWFWKAIKFILGATLFIFLVGGGFMLLWNWIMPTIFGLGAITIWQSFGLILIGRLLFGGFRKGRGRWQGRHKHHMYYQYCQRMKEAKSQVTVE